MKRSPKTSSADINSTYALTLKKTIILSLTFILIFLQLFPRHASKREVSMELNIPLEVIDMPAIEPESPLPTPPPVAQDVITPFIPVVKEEQEDPRSIRENLETVTLDMNPVTDSNLLNNSQLGDISMAGFSTSYNRNQGRVTLDISTDRKTITSTTRSNIDFNVSAGATRQKFAEESIKLDEPVPVTRETHVETPAQTPTTNNELISLNENQFLLKESESTIGTNEYRLWNKINGVFDRLDKNRFGALPDKVRRTASGLSVTFYYGDGMQHDIFWSKGGKVMIRVTGQRPRSLADELGKAFDALFRLTL
ncbi:MAG: hypothetical protein ACOY90_05275 [Candidatus Zhuqueibacterota bacterium]